MAAAAEKPWTSPSVLNSSVFRLLTLCAAAASAYGGQRLGALLPTVHLLGWSVWFGATVYTTFVIGIVLIKALPRQMFGRAQSKLFPWYFALSAVMVGVQAGTATGMQWAPADAEPADAQAKMQVMFVHLGAAMACILVNLVIIEPLVTGTMFARYKLDADGKAGSEEDTKLRKKFGMLHGISSLLNLGTLYCAFAHGLLLAKKLE